MSGELEFVEGLAPWPVCPSLVGYKLLMWNRKGMVSHHNHRHSSGYIDDKDYWKPSLKAYCIKGPIPHSGEIPNKVCRCGIYAIYDMHKLQSWFGTYVHTGINPDNIALCEVLPATPIIQGYRGWRSGGAIVTKIRGRNPEIQNWADEYGVEFEGPLNLNISKSFRWFMRFEE